MPETKDPETCRVLDDMDADQALLAEIDENLVRADLTPSERAAHHAKRKQLYLEKNRGGIEDQIGNAVADLTLRGAMKLLSPPRQSDPHAEETAEGSAGTVAASAVDSMATKDERKILGTKRRRRALNADGPSIPSTGSPSPADLALSISAELPDLRHIDDDGNYEAFKSRWVQYCEGDFAALPAAMQTRFVTEVLNLSVLSGDPSPPSPPFSVQLASMMRC